MQDVATFSGIELGPGTLYTAITRLVENRWIEPQQASGRQRPYRLTPRGHEHLNAQLERMRQLASLGLRRLRLA
jgi:DNA-binding PadR family transcriptional regulator